jgi:ribosomal protein L11 methyltransferase
VPEADVIPATALLETATGAWAAIENLPARSKHVAHRTGAARMPSPRVTVHVPAHDTARAKRRLEKMLLTARSTGSLTDALLEEEDVRDEAWASSWKRFYKPFEIVPGLHIAPTWEASFKAPRGSRVLWLDPGMAFGTGQHPSTQLALELLLGRVKKGAIVLDIGCGSGVLALAAAQAGARVHASDVDPIAVRATADNFIANKLRAVAISHSRDVPAQSPSANIITANITARVLGRLAPSLARTLKPGGILITSGVVESGRAQVLEALRRAGLELVREHHNAGWFAHLHAKRRER